MSVRHSILISMLGLLFAGGRQHPCDAAGPSAADVVSLKTGRTVRGAILGRQPDGSVLVAVSRDWLRKTDAEQFARQSDEEVEQQRRGWMQTKERIEQKLAQPDLSQPLMAYFKDELRRIEGQLALKLPPEPPFFLLNYEGKQVARMSPAPPDRRRIALTAWKENIAGVETRSAAELQKELRAAGIAVDGPPPDLSDLLPVREQSEAEWSTRLAITQYTLDGGIDFQGKGNVLVRTSGAPRIPLIFVLPKLLAGEAEALLGDLLNPGGAAGPGGALGPGGGSLPGGAGTPKGTPSQEDAIKAAIAEVEREGHTGFRVTWLDTNVERLIATVRTEFFAKQPDGAWQSVWLHVETADGSLPRPQAEAAIWANSEVQKLLEPLKGLGFEAALQKSIRFGAAAMAAQKAADGQFFQFRDRYAKRLDGPVLLVPGLPEMPVKK